MILLSDAGVRIGTGGSCVNATPCHDVGLRIAD